MHGPHLISPSVCWWTLGLLTTEPPGRSQNSLPFKAKHYCTTWADHISSVCPSAGGHWGCSHLVSAVTDAAKDTGVHRSFQDPGSFSFCNINISLSTHLHYFFLDSTYKGCHVIFLLLYLTSLSTILLFWLYTQIWSCWLTHLIFERGIIPGYGNDTP